MPTVHQRVTILGAGPSAAFAVRACLDAGIEPVVRAKIFSPPPPGLFTFLWLPESVSCDETNRVNYVIRSSGHPALYWAKRWGETSESVALPRWAGGGSKLMVGFRADDGILNQLWGKVQPELGPQHVLTDEQLLELAEDYDLVVQTFPTQYHLRLYGEFVLRYYVGIYKLEDWLDNSESEPLRSEFSDCLRSNPCSGEPGQDALVLYSGTEHDWFRATTNPFDGTVAVEYRLGHKPVNSELLKLVENRALHPDIPTVFCEIHPRILLTGKWATWTKDEASHWTYARVTERLK